MNVPAKFEVRIALPVPELIGGSPKIWGGTWLCPHSLFPRKILYAYHTDYSTLYALVFPRFSIGVLGGGCESRFWGKGGPRGLGMVPFERVLVSSYRPFTVNFPLSFLYLYAFQRYCRFCSPACHFFPTPPLFSPKFPHVPLEVGGSRIGCKEQRCWANCPYN